MAHSLPISIMWCETFNVGHDTGAPVDDADCQVPFPFTGRIIKLTSSSGRESYPSRKRV
jgi:arylsulfatase